MEVSAICCALKLERVDYISTKLPNILKVFKKKLARLCRYMQNVKPMLKHFKFGIFFFSFFQQGTALAEIPPNCQVWKCSHGRNWHHLPPSRVHGVPGGLCRWPFWLCCFPRILTYRAQAKSLRLWARTVGQGPQQLPINGPCQNLNPPSHSTFLGAFSWEEQPHA